MSDEHETRVRWILDRVMVNCAMLIGLYVGARVGDQAIALKGGLVGILTFEAFDLARRWIRDAWPTIKRWWTR